MRRLLALLFTVLPMIATADDRHDLTTLFPFEADVFVEGDGLARLELPLPVLRDSEMDRADIRLFDRNGREVPFLVDDAPRLTHTLREERRVPAQVLDVRREVVERRDAPDVHREAFDLAVPPASDGVGTWALELDTPVPEFVRQITVRTLGGESATTLIAASVFRLGDGRQKRLLPLPPIPSERVTVSLEGDDGRFLTPTMAFVSSRDIEPPPVAGMSLAATSIESKNGTTAVTADMSSVAPSALRIATSTPLFDRQVRVYEVDRREQRRLIGNGRIFRVGPGAEQVDVPLVGSAGGRLVVEIEDHDSPPLVDVVLLVMGRLPSLVFQLPAAEPGAPAGVLRFGGGRARRAHYDLAALVPSTAGSTPAPLAEALGTLARRNDLARATLGPIHPNSQYDRTPALAFVMHPGAALDASGFQNRRALHVPSSPDGLTRLRLDPADVAHARPDLGDLRVVDGEGRQWAYLLDPHAADTGMVLDVAAPSREETTSSYALALPVPGALLHGVVLDVDGAFFDRPYRLVASPDTDQEHTLAAGRLTRANGQSGPLAIGFGATPVEDLVLQVDDGDDAPLAITRVEGRSPVPDLYLAAPAGDYVLLVGNETAMAPRYELARVRDVVLALDGASIEAGPLAPNPGYVAPSPLRDDPQRPTVVLWIVLGAAVVVLLVTTLRLAGGQRPSPS